METGVRTIQAFDRGKLVTTGLLLGLTALLLIGED